jgi:hypothetical protein
MNTSTAAALLDACEKDLRQFAGTVLAQGEYHTARQIMAWAENVAAMTAVARRLANDNSLTPIELVPAEPPKAKPTRLGTPRGDHESKIENPKSQITDVYPTRMIQDEYPRFLRRDDELVKIGWSKSDRKEYHHRAPKRAVLALLHAVRRIAAAGNRFTSEQLNPLRDPHTSTVFPTYQVFVALAWLRHIGLVRQLGRKSGYALASTRALEPAVESAWAKLPPWPG